MFWCGSSSLPVPAASALRSFCSPPFMCPPAPTWLPLLPKPVDDCRHPHQTRTVALVSCPPLLFGGCAGCRAVAWARLCFHALIPPPPAALQISPAHRERSNGGRRAISQHDRSLFCPETHCCRLFLQLCKHQRVWLTSPTCSRPPRSAPYCSRAALKEAPPCPAPLTLGPTGRLESLWAEE